MFEYKYAAERNLSILDIYDANGTKARFVPARGGILAQLDLSGITVFYMDEETLHRPDLNIRGGNPVLFPICGPLQNGQYHIGDKAYSMGQHGLARNMVWQAEIQCPETLGQVRMVLESDVESKEQYPFDWRLEFLYEIKPLEVTIRQKYTNLSSVEMPFYAGFHPYFYLPGLKLNNIFIPADRFRDIKTGKSHLFNGRLDLGAVPETNLVFGDLTDNRAWFQREDGHTVEVVHDKGFRYLVLWTLRDREFLCLEPWMGDNYDLNFGRAQILKPGEPLETWVSYRVIPKSE